MDGNTIFAVVAVCVFVALCTLYNVMVQKDTQAEIRQGFANMEKNMENMTEAFASVINGFETTAKSLGELSETLHTTCTQDTIEYCIPKRNENKEDS